MRGLLGFRGQRMSGGRNLALPNLAGVINTALPRLNPAWGISSYTLPETLWALIFCTGGGASGNVDAVTAGGNWYGGGGGAAGHSKMLLPRATKLDWSVGKGATPDFGGGGSGKAGVFGGDTTLTINGVLHGTAQGGRAPGVSAPAGRSTATGFQVNRYGGGSGEAGQNGQPQILVGAPYGGGAGGFRDMYPGATGDASDTNTFGGGGVPPTAAIGAGGGCATDNSAACYGGNGQVLILMFRPN